VARHLVAMATLDATKPRPRALPAALAGGWLLALLSAPAPSRAEDFKALLDAAWAARAPAQAALAAREAQAQAGQAAASAWWPEAPALTLAGRGERPGSLRGQREWEAELSLPLWPRGQRARARDSASALSGEVVADAAQARWLLAGALREAWWALRLAEASAQQAQQRLAQAEALLADVALRQRAGDSTPLDQHLAAAERASAAAEASSARAAAEAAARRFAALARGAAPPRQAEQAAAATKPEPAAADDALDPHPEAAALRARIAGLRTRVALADGEARAPMELALGVSRERDGASEPWQHRARIALRLPLGGETQGRPRVAELQAELAAAEAALDDWRAQHAATRAAAAAELRARQEAATAMTERAALLQQALTWVRQAFVAGQFDLPRLLRAMADASQAEAQAEQARIEAARAVSRWNQALGHHP
jgi:cobalt-zinc-cadmium efflux system outer membrane protein